MIVEATADFLSKIKSVAELENATGLALGGKSGDPSQQKLPLPSCWVMYGKDEPDELPMDHGHGAGIVPAQQVMTLTLIAMVYLQYTTEDDLLSVQLPLLRSVIGAIHGKPGPTRTRWRYIGQKLAFVYPDRIAYEQHYTLTAMM